ncbi:MAG: TIGR03905 family TSCPD domain-containing protein [Anaerovoracaceae bacterium]
MQHLYKTKGVCPSKIEFELEGDIARNIVFHGGCNGNLKAIATLVDGMTVGEIKEKLRGNTCGMKSTSCADQLSVALEEALEAQQGE